MFKNVASKIALFAFDTTTGAPKTGDAANLTAYVSKDYGAVTVLADTSATEMDATNAKGWYLFDLAQAETNADALVFSAKSATANVSVVGQLVFTRPNRFSSLGIEVSGKVTGVLVTDTLTTYTGNTPQTGDVFPLASTEIGDIKAKTDQLVFTVANQVDSNALSGGGGLSAAGVRAAVGLASANLDTQLTAIDDFLDTEVAAIKAKTDNLPASPAAVGSAMTLANDAVSAAVLTADAVAEIVAGIAGLNVTELASIPAASPTLIQAIALQYMALRNKIVITATTKRVHNDAGLALASKTLTDDGVTYQETKMA